MRMNPPPVVSMWETPAEFFPWSKVQKSIDKLDMVVYLPGIEFAKEEFGERARACPHCGAQPSDLFWIFMEDSDVAWEVGKGRAGHLTICNVCERQVDFIVDEEATKEFARNWRELGALW